MKAENPFDAVRAAVASAPDDPATGTGWRRTPLILACLGLTSCEVTRQRWEEPHQFCGPHAYHAGGRTSLEWDNGRANYAVLFSR